MKKIVLIVLTAVIGLSCFGILDSNNNSYDVVSALTASNEFMVPPPASSLVLDENFVTVGNSYIETSQNGVAVITENTSNQVGALWTKNKIHLTNNFTYKSYIYWGRSKNAPMGINAGQTGGDGMTVTFQNDLRTTTALGGPGGALAAYKRPTIPTDNAITNAISYEIDPYINNAVGGLDEGIILDLLQPNKSRHMAFVNPEDAIGISKHKQLSTFEAKGFKESNWNQFDITWVPNVDGSGIMTVSVNGYPSSFSISDYKNFFSGEFVHLGFTGSTGGATALQAFAITELPTFDRTLSFDLNGGDGVAPINQSLLEGTLAQPVTDPTKVGYNFLGWNTQSDGLGLDWNFTSKTMPSSDITLYAQYEKIPDGSPVTVNHQDENGNELAPTESLTGLVGAPFKTNPATILGWQALTVPGNSIGVFTDLPQVVTYVYEVSGGLTVEFPTTINFTTTAIRSKDMLIQREDSSIGIRVTDTRIAAQQKNWTITLSLVEELTNGTHQIPGGLVYGDGTNLIPLNVGTQEVYSNEAPIAAPVDINWAPDKGLLAQIPANKALPGDYSGKVLWSLVTGP